MRKKPELLIPAGSPESLRTAVDYGADAVYLGGEAFGLRAKARNFSREEMAEGVRYAHARGKKVHVTVNIIAHESDLSGVRSYLEELREIGPDALIIADPGIFMLAGEICPEIPRHVSTQANNTNSASCRFWHGLGAKRIVLARELTLAEIRRLREQLPEDLELEVFVHGAMCISYSGRCLLSAFLTGRDANRGACTHPCRWKYSLVEESRPGEYFPVNEDADGTYIFNSKDLCMVGHIPDLLEAGVDSYKVEGRMKSPLYVASVARAYRRAIDDCMADPELYAERIPWYVGQVTAGESRPFSTGFFYGKPDADGQIYGESSRPAAYTYLGLVQRLDTAGRPVILQKNKFAAGDTVEIMSPDGTDEEVLVRAIFDAEENVRRDAPHPLEELHLLLEKDGSPVSPQPGLILRKHINGDVVC